MITVMIVDDHPLVRAGLKEVIHKESGMKVVAEASDAQEALKQVVSTDPQVVLLDISLPEKDGIHLNLELKAAKPNLKIVFVSMHHEAEFVTRALEKGGDAYVLKSAESSEIIKAVRAVLNGKKYVSSELTSIILEERDRGHKKPKLTERETEILSWVVKGLSAKEIAQEMKISHRTVEVHKQNIMQKLKAKNIAELVRLSLEGGIV